jgi:hypothetical protein
VAAARFKVVSAAAQTTTNLNVLELRHTIGHNVAQWATLQCSADPAAHTITTGEGLVAYFAMDGTGTITPAGSNKVAVMEVINNHTGAGVDNTAIFRNNATGYGCTNIVGIENIIGTATSLLDLLVTAGTVTNGIKIAGTMTNGINIAGAGITYGVLTSGIFATAAGKAARLAGTVNVGNYGDGASFVESELTLTGIVAGDVAAFGSWINAISATTGANLICAQTNGIYSEVGGILSNSTIIFGMRMQCLCHVNGGVSSTTFYPFSIVNNTNITTALIQCNAASSDLGEVTDNGTDTGKLVPLYKAGSVMGYVKIYTHT